MRLTDLDSLIVEFKKRCRGECCCCTEDYCGSGNDGCGCRVIDEAPTVDAVEVVRCKDCKHSKHWYRDKHLCYLWSETGIGVFEDGYCSYGERREDGRR